jgi:hypothetical protein
VRHPPQHADHLPPLRHGQDGRRQAHIHRRRPKTQVSYGHVARISMVQIFCPWTSKVVIVI